MSDVSSTSSKPEDFKPKPGQIDYTHIRRAPVVNCVVRYGDKILLVRRNERMKFYPGYWNGISGFLDDTKSVREKAEEEVREEAGIEASRIRAIREGAVFEQDEPEYDKTWIVHPVLVDVNTNEIRLDWEAEDYRWVTPEEAKKFKLLPGFGKVLEILFSEYQ